MKRKLPLLLLCLLFLSITLYSGYHVLMEWKEYRAGEEAYASLSQYVRLEDSPSPSEIPSNPTVPTNATEPKEPSEANTEASEPPTETPPDETQESDLTVWPTVDFESLQAINPDVVAWIYLEGTVINYPIVQGEDNSQYLYRLVDGTYNSAGSIFMDYRNEPDFSGRNTILYGHHMKNKSMFGPLTNYKEQSFYDDHPTCLILTPDGNYKLEFFAGYVANLNGQSWKLEFESDEEYGAWLDQAIENSTFQSNITPTPQDRVITLSTCSYEYDDARYVLLGILRPQY